MVDVSQHFDYVVMYQPLAKIFVILQQSIGYVFDVSQQQFEQDFDQLWFAELMILPFMTYHKMRHYEKITTFKYYYLAM